MASLMVSRGNSYQHLELDRTEGVESSEQQIDR